MSRLMLLLACPVIITLLLSFSSAASTKVVEHSFHVKNLTVQRLCTDRVITAVNGRFPGPTIRVHEGDTLIVHVYNQSPYNMTIHWHGVFQRLSAWADGPAMVTQCPIRPGSSYTYRFRIIDQEGTLWWHAHVQWLRATVYGALIIRPRLAPGHSRPTYPFPKPHKQVPILIGEWWNANVVDVENEALATGSAPNNSDAYTINGLPGDLYSCSQNQTYKLKVRQGETYMLRIINAALNNQFFFKIAGHNLIVVAIDASYTNPYVTDVVVIAPGQTTDVILIADQPMASYYMAAQPYVSTNPPTSFDNTTTRGILVYSDATSATPVMPIMPAFNDTPTAHRFYSSLTGLVGGPHWDPVPCHVDEEMFITFGLNRIACDTCQGGTALAASMNNASFQLPTSVSMLQAFFFNTTGGVYSTDFPDNPPTVFDYTNPRVNVDNASLIFTTKSTKVKTLKYNSTVQIVLQNTAILAVENHPIHIHGFDFHVLAQDFGNYDPVHDPIKFNLVDPQIRNTIAVPAGGWAVIRFTANNPGVWFMHCHLDVHLPLGLATAFVVENGPTPDTVLPPPPPDLPRC